MKRIKTADDISSLGTIMSVWAHPDDESYLAAGIMAAAIGNGQTVICITATRGEAGSQDEVKWPSASLGQVRTKELKNALKELGVADHHWLDYADGCCCDVDDNKASRRLIDLIKQYQPDTILTFGPEGMTGHQDHASVSRWTSLAVSRLPKKPSVYHAVHTHQQYHDHLKTADEKLNIFFNIEKPPLVDDDSCDIYFKLPPKIADIKHRSIAAMPSQTEVLLKNFGRDFLDNAFGTECYVKARH